MVQGFDLNQVLNFYYNMKKTKYKLLLLLSILTYLTFNCLYSVPIRVYFSPRGGCLNAIVESIEKSRKSVYVMVYRLTARRIVRALIDAKRRGVKVEVLLDGVRTESPYSKHRELKEGGIKIYLDYSVHHMHDKVALIDGYKVITGSYNFTALAERGNSENIVILENRYIYKRYIGHYFKRKAKSRRY
jgi:phosphatidylserine/phosphatidylglycerophosphate/cardiolipin synthase-like enzyme